MIATRLARRALADGKAVILWDDGDHEWAEAREQRTAGWDDAQIAAYRAGP